MGLTRGFEVVGEARSDEEAVEFARTLAPQMVLMDINLGGMNGIEATRVITAAVPHTVVLLLSTYQVVDLPVDAASSRATAYVNKDDFGPQVLREVWEKRATRQLP